MNYCFTSTWNDNTQRTLEQMMTDAGVPLHFLGFKRFYISAATGSAPISTSLLPVGNVPTTPDVFVYESSDPKVSWPNTATIKRAIGYTTPCTAYITVTDD